MRRALLQLIGLGPFTGDGLARPVNAPPGIPPSYGTQPGTTSPVIIANRVIITGPGGALLIYNGTPAANNLVASDTQSQFTDSFGNVVLAGRTTYHHNIVNGNYWIAVNQTTTATNGNSIVFLTAATEAGPWTTQGVIGPDNAGDLVFGAVNALVASSPYWSAADPNGTGTTPDAFHPVTLDAGWTAGPQAPQYRLAPNGDVELRGSATHASVTATTALNSGTPLVAPYVPAITRFPRGADPASSTGMPQIDTGGIIAVRATAAFPATQIILDSFYSRT